MRFSEVELSLQAFIKKKSNIYIHVNIYVNLVNYNNNSRFRYKMKNTL